jgi:hypothetical protein
MPRREPHHRNVGPRDESDIHWRTLAKFGVAKDSDIVRWLTADREFCLRIVETKNSDAIKRLAKWATETKADLSKLREACEGDPVAEQFVVDHTKQLDDLRIALGDIEAIATGAVLPRSKPRLRDETIVRQWLLRRARKRMPDHTDGNIERVVAALEFDKLPEHQKTEGKWDSLHAEIHQRHLDMFRPDRQKERHHKKQYAKDSD